MSGHPFLASPLRLWLVAVTTVALCFTVKAAPESPRALRRGTCQRNSNKSCNDCSSGGDGRSCDWAEALSNPASGTGLQSIDSARGVVTKQVVHINALRRLLSVKYATINITTSACLMEDSRYQALSDDPLFEELKNFIYYASWYAFAPRIYDAVWKSSKTNRVVAVGSRCVFLIGREPRLSRAEGFRLEDKSNLHYGYNAVHIMDLIEIPVDTVDQAGYMYYAERAKSLEGLVLNLRDDKVVYKPNQAKVREEYKYLDLSFLLFRRFVSTPEAASDLNADAMKHISAVMSDNQEKDQRWVARWLSYNQLYYTTFTKRPVAKDAKAEMKGWNKVYSSSIFTPAKGKNAKK